MRHCLRWIRGGFWEYSVASLLKLCGCLVSEWILTLHRFGSLVFNSFICIQISTKTPIYICPHKRAAQNRSHLGISSICTSVKTQPSDLYIMFGGEIYKNVYGSDIWIQEGRMRPAKKRLHFRFKLLSTTMCAYV